MSQLLPCDLGDGIEVVHDVEAIEVEMDCDLDESAPVELVEPDPGDTVVMLKQWFDEIEIPEDAGTHQFVRLSAPYERIEIEIDGNAYRRATIAHARKLATVTANSDAKALRRPRHALARHRPAGSPETR